MMIDIIGIIGSFLLAFCSIPLAYSAIKYKFDFTNRSFLWIWFTGECLVSIYAFNYEIWILLANYMVNIIMIIITLWYNYRPKL